MLPLDQKMSPLLDFFFAVASGGKKLLQLDLSDKIESYPGIWGLTRIFRTEKSLAYLSYTPHVRKMKPHAAAAKNPKMKSTTRPPPPPPPPPRKICLAERRLILAVVNREEDDEEEVHLTHSLTHFGILQT